MRICRHFFGKAKLRDVTAEQFIERASELSEENELAYKRAKHIISENQRVLEAVEALKANDMVKLGELMAQSHDSMRDDFEITCPEVDCLAEIAQQAIGKNGGARMTGGGFGCVVCLVPNDKVEDLRQAVANNYEKQPALKKPSTFVLPPMG